MSPCERNGTGSRFLMFWQLDSDASNGLAAAEVKRRILQHGFNELIGKEGRTRWQILAEQLSGVLTVLLIIAALISAQG